MRGSQPLPQMPTTQRGRKYPAYPLFSPSNFPPTVLPIGQINQIPVSKETQQKQKILRRGGKNTQENCTKKDLHDPDNHDGVIIHLEPDILKCEVKWALQSVTTNKASGGDGIPVERFQILKDDVVKMLHSICQQIWKTQQWPQGWKRSVFFPVPKKGNAKECSNYHTIALISNASKVMLKVL